MNVQDGIIEKLESFIENNGHLCSPFLESEKDDIRNEVLAEVARMETRLAELEAENEALQNKMCQTKGCHWV